VVGALLVADVVLVVPLWASWGGSVLLLVEELEVALVLQPITRAPKITKVKAVWARDCNFIVVSF
jgi:hypothetical protein